ncbi:MAG: SusE domain-containing protein [Bacteroidota bacterium]
MKHIIKYLTLTAFLFVLITGCEKKVDSLPFYSNGKSVTLTSSTSKVAAVAKDSLKSVLTLSWTNPAYSADSSTFKYILQIDSAGRNFAKAISYTIVGSKVDSFTARDLNNIMLAYGFNFNVAYNLDIRVLSSYGNNNEQYTSNVVTVNMTPYVTPPVVTPPSSKTLFIVGAATQGGWNNPVPTPSQQFYRKDSVTYEGVFNLVGGNQYLLLPVNGDWSQKFAVADASVAGIAAGTGGAFQFYTSGGSNIPAPATSGWYKILVDFQHGTYTVTPYTSTFPANLFLVGSATPGGWNNPVPVPSQQFTQQDASIFSITIALTGGSQYLMLPVNGDWSHKYAVADGTVPAAGGSFGYDASTNFNGPAASGTYTITANFFDMTYTVK